MEGINEWDPVGTWGDTSLLNEIKKITGQDWVEDR